MARFRRIPLIFEAVRFTGDNVSEVADFAGYEPDFGRDGYHETLIIETLVGDLRADVGDWIIKDSQGELAPCRNEFFARLYEPVTDEEVTD